MTRIASLRAALAIALLTLAGCQAPLAVPLTEERPRGPHRAGEVMVRWTATFDPARATELHTRLGTRVLAGETSSLQLIAVPEGQELAFCRKYREAGPDIQAEPNYLKRSQHVPGSFRPARRVLMTPEDPSFAPDNTLPTSWGLREVKAEAAWDVTAGSEDIVVAVIDTGVDMAHPDLAANLDTANAINLVEPGRPVDDDFGHGTHVAGIIAAIGNNRQGSVGIAWRTKIMPIRVLGVDGTGDVYDTVLAIEHAVEKGASVINMSLGSPDHSDIEADAIQDAINAGVVLVAAAGNEAASGNYLEYPACYPGVISVAAVGPDRKRAAFSNFNSHVTIAAPGVDIFSTIPSRVNSKETRDAANYIGPYGFLSGTSMAAPFVAGAAALVLSQHPEWTSQQVTSRLTSRAGDLTIGPDDPPGFDVYFGHGLLNAARAVAN